jgi:uncharacterized protein
MTQPAKGPELSMEEILASIRRIISDEPPEKQPAVDTWRSDGSRHEAPRGETTREEASAGDEVNAGALSGESLRQETRTVGLRNAVELRNENVRSASLGSFRDDRAISEGPAQEPPTRPVGWADAASHVRVPFPPRPPARNEEPASRLLAAREPPSGSLRSVPSSAEATAEEEGIDAVLTALHKSGQASMSPAPAPDRLEPHQTIELEETISRSVLAAADDLGEALTEASDELRPEALPPLPAQKRHRAEPVRDRASDSPPRSRRDGGNELGEQGLVSATTSAAVDSAFNTLAQTVLVQNGRTLEDLVREMLRPMLKVWLDDNLPSLVERLVRAEIERVSRGRGQA